MGIETITSEIYCTDSPIKMSARLPDPAIYKITQVDLESRPVLLFGTPSMNIAHDVHSIILYRFFKQFDIAIGQEQDQPFLTSGGIIVPKEGSSYELVGAGVAAIGNSQWELYGESMHYEMPINRDHIARLTEIPASVAFR